MDNFLMDNSIEKRKYKRLELEKWKYKEIVSPCITRFRVKQYDGQEMPSLEWNIVAVKNLSAGGIMFNYYKMNLGVGSLLELKIDFIKSIPTISCIGRVVRIEDAHANSMFRIATEFTEINDQDRKIINTTVEAIMKREAKKRAYLEKQGKIRNALVKMVPLRSKIRNALVKMVPLRTVLHNR
ncbi:MAG: PilZ domain-containing protein [Planctomycetota bacterium]